MYHFHPLFVFEDRAGECQNPPRVFGGRHCVEIIAVPPSRGSAFYVAYMCAE